ncbi:MAG: phosphate ABC transporter permease PstA [Deltaproteobacteria bacterium]|nr:phosphate ABC transporter permease PstA [Deltaproteobacteria bacterium]
MRKIIDWSMSGAAMMATLCGLIPLILISMHLLRRGISSINLDFFTHMPQPVGEPGGGMANAIIGTCLMVGIATAIALPIGLLGGLYLSEFGERRTGAAVRFAADMLNGIPSIVIGIFVYGFVVVPLGHFSAMAGGIALSIIMMPMILRNTEEMLRLVPHALREAALALGIPYWKTLLRVVLVTARRGIVTGILLALARIAGETAPLLFTALGNQFWSLRLDQPMAALPLQIFTYAISPFEEWQQQAWSGALVLIGIVVILSLLSRWMVRVPQVKTDG